MIWYYYVCSCSTAAWGRGTHRGGLEVVTKVLHKGSDHVLTWGEETE